MDPIKSQPTGKPGPAASVQGNAPEQTNKPEQDVKLADGKPAETDKTETGFIADLGDVLATSKSRSTGGAKIRPNVGYTLVADGVKKLAGTNVPEQEQVLLKILNKALTPTKPVISEVDLNKLVVAAYASGALKTKQDAWHIFRYYRTDLIKRGALKQVEIALAA